MRTFLFVSLLLCSSFCIGQETYRTESGTITFDASTPLEDIHAVNKKVNTVIKDNGEIASLLLVREFEFRKKLMQEHFNENYIESDKYPKAYFVGKIASFDPDEITEEPVSFELSGDLTLHGVTRPIMAELNIRREGESLSMETTFMVRTEDFKIKVPRLLFKKIAEEIQVEVSASLNKT